MSKKHRTPRKNVLLLALLALASLAFVFSLTAAIEQPGVDLSSPSWKQAPDRPENPLIAVYLDQQAEPRALFPAGPEAQRTRLFDGLKNFYEARGHAPAWVSGTEVRTSAQELIQALRAAGRHGLDPADYRTDALAARADAVAAERFPMPVDLVELDLGLTAAFLLYADHLTRGRVDPAALEGEWHVEPDPVDSIAVLTRAVEEDDVVAALDELTPDGEGYRGLVTMRERYAALVANGGWPRVPEGGKLEVGKGADAERLRALVARLRAEGDLGDEEAAALEARWQTEEPSYDETLAAAVTRFQTRHGLETDGKVGRDTLATLNVTAEERLRQIELNLERWRWLASLDFPDRHIHVNVPEYRLRGYDEGRVAIEMNVVVGKTDWQTPIFSNAIQYLEVNPYWNVPDTIAFDEVIPEIRKNPAYLAKEDMEVIKLRGSAPEPSTINWWKVDPDNFPYRIRQRPGPKNALGQIKFIFPNSHDVYLHDTPAQSAFKPARRALSHGCVRVERPLDLARYVLSGEPKWSFDDVAAALDAPEREMQQMPLSEPLPVFILYWTAFQDGEGVAHFRDDVYGHDRVLAAALDALERSDALEPVRAQVPDDQRARKPRVST